MRNPLLTIAAIAVLLLLSVPVARACESEDVAAGDTPSIEGLDYITAHLPNQWKQIAANANFDFKAKEAERRALDDALTLLESNGDVDDVGESHEVVAKDDRWKVAARLFKQAGKAYEGHARKWAEMERIRTGTGKYAKPEFRALRSAVTREFAGSFAEAAEAYQELAEQTGDRERYRDAARAYLRRANELKFMRADQESVDEALLGAGDCLRDAEMFREAGEVFAQADDQSLWEDARSSFETAGDRAGVARMLSRLDKATEAAALFRELAREHESAHRVQEAIWAYRQAGETETADRMERETVTYLTTAGKDKMVSIVPLGGGKNGSFLVTFENGMKAVFKAVFKRSFGSEAFDAARVENEARMWRLDRELRLDRVPITVARSKDASGDRRLLGAAGSLQLFIHDARMGRDAFVRDKFDYGDLAWLDLIAAYWDRNDDNYFVPDHIGIDNEDAFNYGRYESLRNPRVPFSGDAEDVVHASRPSRRFVDGLRALDEDRIGQVFPEIAAPLIRVRRMTLDLIDMQFEESELR